MNNYAKGEGRHMEYQVYRDWEELLRFMCFTPAQIDRVLVRLKESNVLKHISIADEAEMIMRGYKVEPARGRE
jgi:hypothetical protein